MKKTRVHVPMTDETRGLLEAFAEVSGKSIAKVCEEILEETAPVMAELTQAMKMAKTAPAKAMREVNKTLE